MTRRVSSAALVGRRHELERLSEGLEAAAAGQPGVVLVAGEAGVGKTRLVAEFALRASDAGARVLQGACVPLGDRSLAYGPFTDAYRRLFRTRGHAELERLLGPAHAELAWLLPGLSPGPVPAEPRGVPAEQTRLLPLLLGSLRRLAAATPLLFVLDDLQWADDASLEALSFLARSLRDERVLFVAAYRTDDLRPGHPLLPVLGELDRACRVEWLDLRRLDEVDLARLLAGIIGRDPDPALVGNIHARSGGNPYFAEELIALGAAGGSLPGMLREVLLARLDGLHAPTRALLDAASVAGPRFDGQIVAQVDGLDARALAAAFRQALDRHLLVALEGPGDAFEFRHALLAEAVYADLLPVRRRQLHAACARVLETRLGEPPDRAIAAALAHHWQAAGEPSRAFAASIGAGRAAASANASIDARDQLERAVGLWDAVPGAVELAGTDRAGLLAETAAAASLSGSFTQAAEHLRDAIRLLGPNGDPARAGLLYERLGAVVAKTGDPDASLAAYREAIRLVPADPASATGARILAGLSRGLMYTGAWAESERVARDAIAAARDVGLPDVEADALATLGAVQGTLGDVEAGIDSLRRGRDLALRVGALEAGSRAWSNLAGLLEGRAWVREALAAVEWDERVGLGLDMGTHTRVVAAWGMVQAGDWNQAALVLEQTRRIAPEGRERILAKVLETELAVHRGEPDAPRALDELEVLARACHDEMLLAFACHLEALLLLQRGRPGAARGPAGEALALLPSLPPDHARSVCELLVTALRAEADVARAARAHGKVDPLEEARRRGEAILGQARALAAGTAGAGPHRWRGPGAVADLCSAEQSRLDGANDPGRWRVAVAECDAAEQGYLGAYARSRLAEAMLEHGDGPDAAGSILLEAHAAAVSMGAAPLRASIEALARRGRISIVPAPGHGSASSATRPERRVRAPFGLTPRELEVLALVAAGRTNREIARTLYITEGTAGIHVSNVLGKLEVAHRAEAASLAVRLGLVPDPEGPPDAERPAPREAGRAVAAGG